MSELGTDADLQPEDERGSEVDDYTGETPRVEREPSAAARAGAVPSGFGDGDVADVDDGEQRTSEEQLAADVEGIVAELDQYRDLAMRLQADFENFRKRTAAQQRIDIDRATGRLVEALLPVLDATEAAYVRHPDEVGPLLNLMLAELRKQGLETLDLEDKPFDPTVAEAVAHESAGGGEVVVSEVLRSGYRWRGETLRPAMVRTRD